MAEGRRALARNRSFWRLFRRAASKLSTGAGFSLVLSCFSLVFKSRKRHAEQPVTRCSCYSFMVTCYRFMVSSLQFYGHLLQKYGAIHRRPALLLQIYGSWPFPSPGDPSATDLWSSTLPGILLQIYGHGRPWAFCYRFMVAGTGPRRDYTDCAMKQIEIR